MENFFLGGGGAGGNLRHRASGATRPCPVPVACVYIVRTLLAYANFARPCQRESQNIPIFAIKESNIVRTHSCDSKEAKNEISRRILRFKSAKPSFQVPLKTRVHNLAYNNMTKP